MHECISGCLYHTERISDGDDCGISKHCTIVAVLLLLAGKVSWTINSSDAKVLVHEHLDYEYIPI